MNNAKSENKYVLIFFHKQLKSVLICYIILLNLGDFMDISKEEYMKILDYILENNKELIDGYYISNDFLLQIRNYVKGKRLDNNFMLAIHKNILINHFLTYGNSFNNDTPLIIKENEKCIKKSLNNDIYSINFITYNNEEDENKYINYVLNKDYILSNNSPLYLKTNKDVIIKSIKLDYNSANYIYFNLIDKMDQELIIEELLKTNYILTENSSMFLRKNRKINIHSIKLDINSFKYSVLFLGEEYDIFKILIDNNYQFDEDDIENLEYLPISYITSSNILNKLFEMFDIYESNNLNYKDLFSKLYFNALTNYPTIKSFDSILNYLSEKSWEEYKLDNMDNLSNIYGKIISLLKNSKTFYNFYQKFYPLENNIKTILEDKYDILFNEIKTYYSLYHNDNKDKSKLEDSSLIISKLSALYIAGSKELHKSFIKNNFYKKIKFYYRPRLDNKIINKRILQYIKKDIFKKSYNDNNVVIFLDNLKNKYLNLYGEWFNKAYLKFITKDYTDLKLITKSPNNYNLFIKYIEAKKLVNRLNSGYIKYDDIELSSYRDVIIFDNNKYICNINANKFDIEKCNNYREKEIAFKLFIKEVMLYINQIKVDENIYNRYLEDIDLDQVIGDLPFNDTFYEFDSDLLINIKLDYFIKKCIDKEKLIKNEILSNNFDIINNILINNSFIWLWLLDIGMNTTNLMKIMYLKKYDIIKIINNINKIVSYSNIFKMDINEFKNIMFLNDMGVYCNSRSYNLLGPDIIKILCNKTDYTQGHSKKEILNVASDLICQMAKRDKSTVPYINEDYNGYHYSMYDNLNEDVLLTGSNVDSCLKACGNDNDFLHYCCINKNGFIIKITNSNNNFIARVAGVRCGNYIYLNQLRTIYDKGGTGYCGKYECEKKEIIEVLIKACEDIVRISKNNSLEKIKIDYIFINHCYAFNDYPIDNELSNTIINLIGNKIIDLSSNDWRNFINNTKNLQESTIDNCFRNDYKEYNLICLTSNKDININKTDVPALYKRNRNKLIVTNNITSDIIRKTNKIRTIYAYYHDNINYSDIKIDNDSIVIIGDNWYLIYKDKIIDYCIQDFDISAKLEYDKISKILLDKKIDNKNIKKLIKKI